MSGEMSRPPGPGHSDCDRNAVASDVLLVDEAEAVEREPGLAALDVLRQRRDQPGQPAGRDDRALAELVLDALAQAIDLRGEAVDGARLDALDRALAQHAAGLDQLDGPERGGPTDQGVHADADA